MWKFDTFLTLQKWIWHFRNVKSSKSGGFENPPENPYTLYLSSSIDFAHPYYFVDSIDNTRVQLSSNEDRPVRRRVQTSTRVAISREKFVRWLRTGMVSRGWNADTVHGTFPLVFRCSGFTRTRSRKSISREIEHSRPPRRKWWCRVVVVVPWEFDGACFGPRFFVFPRGGRHDIFFRGDDSTSRADYTVVERSGDGGGTRRSIQRRRNRAR